MDIPSLFTDHTTLVAAQAPVMSQLAGEAVILDPVSGIYYGLSNDVGIRIWQLIQTATTVGDVRAAILSEYEVDPQQCDRDITEILQLLVGNNLAGVVNASMA